ncbi:glucose-6-phosphate dehydrogenase [Sugiyamaella lignohabitans]|uniref:Glucose-6-phosphate 1-dehydrogenase n=1 Tax=Sugiyamaella lignohabitans TaxID=796027 RepID=A0A167E3I9_9ASCO|nr:glucose-6-phosphate dehydrogenase [Sugiyamaella lignohabitans]ANB13594.1 glucose-6-phosphate dehydrogenase [Sugiyamaella lignohabitans]
MDEEEYKKRLSSNFKLFDDNSKKQAKEFLELCTYVHGKYDEDAGFQDLEKHVRELEKPSLDKGLKRDRLYYLALPPSVFGTVTAHLKKNNYPGDEGHAKVIIEKPFGHDLESSRVLQKAIAPVWTEDEVYRIDHYLGKEMVKNILALRFANQFFNASWNRQNIACVQISFKEPFGTEGRGGYFDEIGIIRDVMQNHLLQVLSLIAMERPVSFAPEDIRDEKVKVLKAIPPIELSQTILGQYDRSEDGAKPAYTDDETVPKGSKAVTFAALQLSINNDRWEGVPFILKAGKALDEAKVEIRIQFKDVAQGIFQNIARNELVLRIQPKEAIYLKMNAKYPGLGTRTVVTDLDLSYHRRYSDLKIPEAYEALILDALKGDHSNFVRDDELDVSWKIFTPLLHKIDSKDEDVKVEKYAYGSRGPASVNQFLADRGYVRDNTKSYQWPVTKGNL